jgi:hypothetical protein
MQYSLLSLLVILKHQLKDNIFSLLPVVQTRRPEAGRQQQPELAGAS